MSKKLYQTIKALSFHVKRVLLQYPLQIQELASRSGQICMAGRGHPSDLSISSEVLRQVQAQGRSA